MGFFGRFGGKDEGYVEVQAEPVPERKTLIEIEQLQSLSDTDRLQKKVREGAVMLVKIKEMKSKDMNELKKAIAKIRKTCMAIEGDIMGVGNDWIIIAPSYAKLQNKEDGGV